jgi:REP element-mobilizing transposase RayT
MLRGINRQDIFEDKEDYVRMLTCLQQMLEEYDEAGNHQPPLCTFYAYCLMSNHIHLLLKTNQKDIGSTIKHLAVTYAMYYNNKYSRSGHVFQDRFKSEPVNDMAYFMTLLRYIHQNRRRSESRMKLASIMPSEKEEDDSQSSQGWYSKKGRRL